MMPPDTVAMGHLAGKDLLRQVGEKLDGLPFRAPWNETLRAVLAELYSPDEAELFVAMPYGLATAPRIARALGQPEAVVQRRLESMADRGLVVDLLLGDETRYMPSPLAVGLFEFTMMRSGDGVDSARLARLFRDYMGDGAVWAANAQDGARVNIMRALPHEEALAPHVEILDYEKASALVERAERFSVGICSCRHEREHAGGRECDGPLEVCTAFDGGADFLVRHGLARAASREEMRDRLARSRDEGLVLSADNVQRHVGFICHCCRCCCNLLHGYRDFGSANAIVTASVVARADETTCEACGNCVAACPVGALAMTTVSADAGEGARSVARVDESRCLGCGVCALDCAFDALHLHARAQRVLHPETTFERVILQCLERGTLQNQIFDDPGRLTHTVMRAILGAFLRLPATKKALMSDLLRSRFLGLLAAGVRASGGGAALEF